MITRKLSAESQVSYSDLVGSGGGLLSYDFRLLNCNNEIVLVEYQGIQHYKPIEYFGGREKLKIQKDHDRRKRQYAKKHGYHLIEVSYEYDTYEKVAAYLDEHFLPLMKQDRCEDIR